MLIVDPITGKMWKLAPYATGNLSPIGAESAAVAPAIPPAGTQPKAGTATQGNGGKVSLEKGPHVLKIVCLDQVPEELRDKMVRIN